MAMNVEMGKPAIIKRKKVVCVNWKNMPVEKLKIGLEFVCEYDNVDDSELCVKNVKSKEC
jgi:hypothetical protein